MNNLKSRSTILLVLILILATLLIAVASSCEPCHDVTLENSTESTLVIIVGDRNIGTVQPRQRLTHAFCAVSTEWLISAKDLSDKIVYSKKWTVKELAESNWKVVITSP